VVFEVDVPVIAELLGLVRYEAVIDRGTYRQLVQVNLDMCGDLGGGEL
jgi:hypothetical protein